jgi:hydrogenase expression/formation protein HypC
MACNHDRGCITCGDVAVPLRVVALERDGLVVCESEEGEFEDVDVSLVDSVGEGDVVLVHARVALSKLEAAA